MSLNNENNPQYISVVHGSVSGDLTVPVMYFPKKVKLIGAYVINGASVAASNSDYATIRLLNGSTELAELDTRAAHENGLTANVAKAMNLSDANDHGQVEIAAGSTIKVEYNETEGTPDSVALTEATIVLAFFPV